MGTELLPLGITLGLATLACIGFARMTIGNARASRMTTREKLASRIVKGAT